MYSYCVLNLTDLTDFFLTFSSTFFLMFLRWSPTMDSRLVGWKWGTGKKLIRPCWSIRGTVLEFICRTGERQKLSRHTVNTSPWRYSSTKCSD
jgi:hypothetical protein